MTLSLLSMTMFFGSYLAGSIPLAMTFSESKLRCVSIFGAGLLVGTALAVIIPEGVQSLYEAESELHNRQFHHEAEHILEESAHQPPEIPPRIPPEAALANQQKTVPSLPGNAVESRMEGNANEIVAKKRSVGERKLMQMESLEIKDNKESEMHQHLSHQAHGAIGMALVAGFVFMLIIDQVTRSTVARGDSNNGVGRSRYKITATVGLVVHAAADGIALGAASSIKHADIQFIVFVAIMLHKAPAAFGLVTFLLVEGLEKPRIRRHLLIFSLAAPLMALITYIGIAQGGNATLSSLHTTGLLMLFSAGTFLYVATVHVLPEMTNVHAKGYHALDSGLPSNATQPQIPPSGHSHHGPEFKLNELFALVSGAAVPAFLSLGHSHQIRSRFC